MPVRSLLTTFVLALLIGCGSGDKPGADPEANPQPPADPVDVSMAVRLPPKSVLAAGESEEIDVEYVHSDEITGSITVTFEPPEGVTVTPETLVLNKEASMVKATIAVGEDVAAGDSEIGLKAVLGEQQPASLSIPLTVKAAGGE